MSEPTDATIEAWIGPATTSLTPEDIGSYQGVISHAVTKLTAASAPNLVAVAHRIGKTDAEEWLTALVRAKRTDFVGVNNGELLARVACCIAVGSLESSLGLAPLIGLLVQSAGFMGVSEPTGELAAHAAAAVDSAAIAVRQRQAEWTPVAAEVSSLLAQEPAEAVEGAAAEPDGLEKAMARLAQAIDALAARSDEREKAVDEEYGALWWSYSRRSVTTGEPWDDIKPLGRRVVLTAHELGRRITRHPGPPMVRSLIGAALGNQASKPISLADVALAAVDCDVDVAPNAKNRLLPISSAVAQIAELGSDGNTWRDVLDKSIGLNVAVDTPALEAALQLVREVEIGKYLE